MRSVLPAAALLLLSACGGGGAADGGRSPSARASASTDASRETGRSRKPFFERPGMEAYLKSHPALARQIREASISRSIASGSWVSRGVFNGMSRLRVSMDADNLVVMEVVAPGGRVVAWSRGTVLSRTPYPSGSLSSPGPVLRRFSRWSTRMSSSGAVLVGDGTQVPMVAVAPSKAL